MKLFLQTNSLTLPSSGVANIIEDVTVQKDSNGLPFIPGKTIKGLVREAAERLCELLEKAKADDLKQLKNHLFGQPGGFGGKMHFPNLYPVQNTFKPVYRYQTALDENGNAKKGSLRKYELLDSGLGFTGESITLLSQREAIFLSLACLLIERMGVRRNRGWGNISVSTDVDIAQLNDTIHILYTGKDETLKFPSFDVSERHLKLIEETGTIYLKLTAQSPLIFTEADRTTFNVDTKTYIPGKSIRGLIANHYIKKNGAKEPIKDPLFKQLFLKSGVCFGNAMPFARIVEGERELEMEFHTVPINIVYPKYGNRNEAINLYKEKNEDKPVKKTTSIKEYGKLRNTALELKHVCRDSNFHHQRDRFKGLNRAGKIFYYESIDKDQSFIAKVTGGKDDLIRLLDFIPPEARVGRSRSSQYGQVQMEVIEPISFDAYSDQNSNSNEARDEWTVFANSPIILINPKTGVADPALMDDVLGKLINGASIEKRMVRFSQERIYEPLWKCHQTIVTSIAQGSSFLIKFDKPQTLSDIRKYINKGIGEMCEFGFGQLGVWELQNETIPVKKVEHVIPKQTLNSTKSLLEKSEEIQRKGNGKLTNSLCGGLIELLMKYRSEPSLDWKLLCAKRFLKLRKGQSCDADTWKEVKKEQGKMLKPAGKKLYDISQDDSNLLLKFKDIKKKDIEWWITVFKYVQKINSSHDRK